MAPSLRELSAAKPLTEGVLCPHKGETMNDAEKKPELQGKLREFLVMRNLYEAAARQLTLKF